MFKVGDTVTVLPAYLTNPFCSLAPKQKDYWAVKRKYKIVEEDLQAGRRSGYRLFAPNMGERWFIDTQYLVKVRNVVIVRRNNDG